MRHADQMQFDMPPPPRPEIDFEATSRVDLNEALALAKAAATAPPWDYRTQRYWRIVFPQMANWLPVEEREPLVAEFLVEWKRINALFPADECEALEAYGREREALS